MTYNLPDTSYRTQIFYNNGFWVKPQGITMIYITCISGGGGGGGGQTSALGVAGTGGGGGGVGQIFRVLISADVIDDGLRVTVGLGGNGGAAASNGLAGGQSRVERYNTSGPSPAVTVIAISFGGGGGTSGTGGGTGASGSVGPTSSSAQVANLSVFASLTSTNAANGGNATFGASITYGVTSLYPLSSGAGGGGKNTSNVGFSGGSIVGSGVVSTIDGGAAEGGNGQDGFSSLQPFIQTGASGGAGNGTATGGIGGNGQMGCGGGGGGAGITGGAGGRGGNGMVIINCW